MKRAFSLVEIIITILIIGLIGTFAITKLFNSIDKSNELKIKSEVALVNEAINRVYSSQILLANSNFFLERLDDASINSANESLFIGYEEYILLDTVILSSSLDKKELGKWIKVSNTNYRVYLTKEKVLDFVFDTDEALFSCDKKDDACKEFML
ncbi:MAG: prepilin-type N-terminal cleavage/methylation domain-containing protein [Arcobacter sp.]|uniref:prepilin-type N-terminal cleavage/methylation domain-containing protein n=1 Tax=Arcobacter sp. TaxID=1872629 RepID=UPI003AFFAB0B